MVEEGEEGAVAAIVEGAQEEGNFFAGEDVREGLFASDFDLGPDLPAEAKVVAEEGAQRTDGLVDGVPLELELGLQVEEEIEDEAAF